MMHMTSFSWIIFMRRRLIAIGSYVVHDIILLGVNFFSPPGNTHTLYNGWRSGRRPSLVRPPLILPIPSFIKILYDSYYYESSLLLIANDSLMSYSEYYSLESSSDSSLCENVFFLTNIFFFRRETIMFKAKFNDKKFKTNVRLCINRLKLVEKKKTEMALKARKEIADYIKISKTGIYFKIKIFGR